MRASSIFFLYTFFSFVLTPAYILKGIYNVSIGKDRPLTFFKRFSFFLRTRSNDYPRKIWIHAASMGESLIALNLADSFYEKLSKEEQSNTYFIITTVTSTSANLVTKKTRSYLEHQFMPFDIMPFVIRFINKIQPTIGIFIESELWPNLLHFSSKKCPLYLFNARLSDRSYKRWQKNPELINFLMSYFQSVLTQSEKDQEKLTTLGLKHCTLYGNIKLSQQPLPVCAHSLVEMKKSFEHKPTFLAASTHLEDEHFLLKALQELKNFHEHFNIIFVIRHPHRGTEVQKICEEYNFKAQLRSKNSIVLPDTQIYIVDTLGELGTFFSLSDIVFMGGSMKQGGHNILEPAHFNNLLVTGPDMSNFHNITQSMLNDDALIQLNNDVELFNFLSNLSANSFKESYQQTIERAALYSGKGQHILQKYLAFMRQALGKIS